MIITLQTLDGYKFHVLYIVQTMNSNENFKI